MTDLPPPLTPADCDLAGYRWMPLDVERVIDSDTFGLCTGDEFKTAFRLWAKSWKQVPAASLPSDDRLLAHLAGLELPAWRKRKANALRGWILCSDGRLYHPVIAEKAIEAMGKRDAHVEREQNEETRQQRLRARRKAMFDQLREHGIVPPWDTKTSELERLIASLPVTPNVTGSVTGSVTGDVTSDAPPTAMTGPDRTETVNPGSKTSIPTVVLSKAQTDDDFVPKDEAEWLRHLKAKHGFEADPTNVNDRRRYWQTFSRWVNAGVKASQIDAAIAKAYADSTEPISNIVAYADRVLETMVAPKKPKADDWHRTDEGIKRKARELGFGDGRPNESWDSLKARCWDEIKRREARGATA